MPKKPTPTFSEYDIFPCLCPPLYLLHKDGCGCGAWQAAMGSYERALEMHALGEYGAMRRVRDFFIRPPTPNITFRSVCDDCGHPPHGHATCGECNCRPGI